MGSFVQKLQHFIENQFPGHVRADYPVIVDFVEAYYKFLDQDGEASNLLMNSATWTDIDVTLDAFVPYYKQQYAVDIPSTALLQARRIVKHINEYYEAKGSENAAKMFFRFMFNESISVQYPGDHILRASDGRWSKRRIIKVDSSAFQETNIFDLKNSTISLNYVEFIPNQGRIIRSVSTSCFNVTRQIEPNIFQLEVDISPEYRFPALISEVSNVDINGDGVPDTIETLGDFDTHVYVVQNGIVYGSITKQIVAVQQVIDPGHLFKVDDAYVIGQTGIEGRYFVLGGLSGYIDDEDGPYVFEEFDNNAIIRVSRITESPERGISQLQLVNTGQRFLARIINTLADVSYFETPDDPDDNYVFNSLNPGAGADDYAADVQELIPVDTFSVEIPPRAPRNVLGESAEIVFRTGLVYEQPGSFKDSSGFLSDINHLQDNYYYQPYSYVIESQQQKSVWEDVYKKSNHPAGFKLFAVLRFADLIDASVAVVDQFDVFADALTIEILQGETIIATRSINPGSTWADTVITLSSEEVALITDPNDLQIVIRKTNSNALVLVADLSMELLGTP